MNTLFIFISYVLIHISTIWPYNGGELSNSELFLIDRYIYTQKNRYYIQQVLTRYIYIHISRYIWCHHTIVPCGQHASVQEGCALIKVTAIPIENDKMTFFIRPSLLGLPISAVTAANFAKKASIENPIKTSIEREQKFYISCTRN